MPRDGNRNTYQGGPQGSVKAQEELISAAPMAEGSPTPSPSPSSPGVASAGGEYIDPSTLPNIMDPTANPSEPIQSGLPIGPGQGSPLPATQYDIALLREMFKLVPSEDVRKVLERAEMESTSNVPLVL